MSKEQGHTETIELKARRGNEDHHEGCRRRQCDGMPFPAVGGLMRSVLMTVTAVLTIALNASLLASCDDVTDYISRRYPCRFIFDETQHPTSLLFSALKSPGTYVTVTTSGDGRTTLRHVYVTSNDGRTATEDNVIRTDRENYNNYQLGARNDIGLIVGCTNFNGLTAYDRACPNCADLQTLNFGGNRQQVVCTNCQRLYDLETGACTTGGDALWRYLAKYNGQWLSVSN